MASSFRVEYVKVTHSCRRSSRLRFPSFSSLQQSRIRNYIAFVCLLSLSSLLVAQDNNSSRIDFLRGGDIGLRLKWSGESFSGLGTRADAMGGSISSLYASADAISTNPAALGFARGFHITLDWAPPLRIDPTGILGIQKRVNTSLHETAEKNAPGGVVAPGTVEDADVHGELDMQGGLKGGAVAYGTDIITVGIAFHQPFEVENQMSISGMEFNAAALDDAGDVTHRLFGTVNGNINLEMIVENSSFALGVQLPNGQLGLGLAVDSFSGDMKFEGTILPEGIISTRNSEANFNDPHPPHYDSLYAVIRGDWDGETARFRAGFAYHVTPSISLDAVLVSPINLDLKGPFSMIHNNIRALNIGAGEDEDVFDVDVLVEDNLTKTQKKVTSVPGLRIAIPGQAAVGFSAKWGEYLGSVVLIKYLNDFGYEFAYVQTDSVGETLESGRIRQGLDLGTALRVGIGVRPLMLGLGVVLAKSFTEEFDLDSSEPKTTSRDGLFVPFFSLGGGVQLGRRFRLDYSASLYNSSFLRLSTSYQL